MVVIVAAGIISVLIFLRNCIESMMTNFWVKRGRNKKLFSLFLEVLLNKIGSNSNTRVNTEMEIFGLLVNFVRRLVQF
uniref:Uncharacterized protein n=1 Tax=Lepeophtheirus salmonis TaxID=72036 RepID=A0A0K2U1Z7_LEPSM